MSDNVTPATFVPTLVDDRFGTILIEVLRCSVCKVPTVAKPWKHHWCIFPNHWQAARHIQLQRAGWKDRGGATTATGGLLCVDCEKEHARWTCALCGNERQGPYEELFGCQDTDYLCKPCYEVTPAKVWDAKCRELEAAHAHDCD